MTANGKMRGVITALVTPMKGGEVDLPAFEAHLDRQIEGGVFGVSPNATTGESPTLSEAEAALLISTTVKRVNGAAFVMAGAGANSTKAAVEKARKAADLGADGILVVAPYYNKPSQRGMLDHFAAVAQSVSVPVMLYNVPGRTGVDISVETCATLYKEVPNIVAMKEASGRIERIVELRLACGPDFVIMTGDDNLALPALAVGADGIYSVASNLIPAEMVALHRAWSNGDVKGATNFYHKAYRVLDDLFIESNPVPVKAALAKRGWMTADVRAPLSPISSDSWSRLEKSLALLEA